MLNDKDNSLKFTEDVKNTILEMSALSGIPQNIIREVLEFLVYKWGINLAENPDKFTDLTVPYLGTVSVKYIGDIEDENGNLSTDVRAFVKLSDSFKKLVGDIHDDAPSVLTDMIEKKIEQSILVSSNVVNS